MPIKAEFIILILGSIQLLSVCFSTSATVDGIDVAEHTKNYLTGDSFVLGEASSLESAHYLVRTRRDDSQLSSTTTERPLIPSSSTVEPGVGNKENVASSKKSKSKHSKHSSKSSKSSNKTTTTSAPIPTTTTESPNLELLRTTTKAKPQDKIPADEANANPIASSIHPPANNDDEDPKESAAPLIGANYQDQDSPSKSAPAAPGGDPNDFSDDGAPQPDNNQQPYIAQLSTTGAPSQDTTNSNTSDQNGAESGGSRAELAVGGEPKPQPAANIGLMPDLSAPQKPIVEPAAVTTKTRKLRKKKNKKKDQSGKSGKRRKGKKGKRKKASKKSTYASPPTDEIIETKTAQYPVEVPIPVGIVPSSNNSSNSLPPPRPPPPPPSPAPAPSAAPSNAKVSTAQPSTSAPQAAVDKKAITPKGASLKPLNDQENMELEELEKIEQQAKLNNFQFKRVTLKLLGDVSTFLSANGNKVGEIDWRSTVAHGIGEVLFGLGASKMFDQDVSPVATSGGPPAPAPAPTTLAKADPAKAAPGGSRSSISSSDPAEASDEATDTSSRAGKIEPAAKTTKAPQAEQNKATTLGPAIISKQTTTTSATTPSAKAPPANPVNKSTPQPPSTAAPAVVTPSTLKPTAAVPTTAKASVSTTTKAPSSPAPSSPASPSPPATTKAPTPPAVVVPNNATTTPKPLVSTTAAPALPNATSTKPVIVPPPPPPPPTTSLPVAPAIVGGKPAVPTTASAADTGTAITDGLDVPFDGAISPKKPAQRKPFRRLALLNRLKNGGTIYRNRLRNRNRLAAQPALRLQRKQNYLTGGKNRRKSKILIMKKGPRRGFGGVRQRQLGLRRPVFRNDDYPGLDESGPDTDYTNIENPDSDSVDLDEHDTGDDDYSSGVYNQEKQTTDDAASPDYDQQQPVEFEETVSTMQQPRKKPKANQQIKNRLNSKKANDSTTRKNKRKKTDESDIGASRSSLGALDADDNSYNNYDDLNVNNNNIDIEY